jgi:hypothetical protein
MVGSTIPRQRSYVAQQVECSNCCGLEAFTGVESPDVRHMAVFLDEFLLLVFDKAQLDALSENPRQLAESL